MSSDLGARGLGTCDDDGDDDVHAEQQQHAGWRSTYTRTSLDMSVTELMSQLPMSLIEDLGILQRSEGREAMWSEQRSRSEGIGNGRR